MFKVDEQTGYIYYSFSTIVTILNIMYHKCSDDIESIPWDYISVLLEEMDDCPEA